MLRSFFFAIGLFVVFCGGQFVIVDRMIMNLTPEQVHGTMFRDLFITGSDSRLVLDPAEWVAFLLLSIGSVTMLYSVALPKIGKERDE